jgi:hypothetical protein
MAAKMAMAANGNNEISALEAENMSSANGGVMKKGENRYETAAKIMAASISGEIIISSINQ